MLSRRCVKESVSVPPLSFFRLFSFFSLCRLSKEDNGCKSEFISQNPTVLDQSGQLIFFIDFMYITYVRVCKLSPLRNEVQNLILVDHFGPTR